MPERTGKAAKKPTEGKCYCGLWKKDPSHLKKQGIPPGYCGLCRICGKPGHTRHFPGAVPFTGAWCDKHYHRVRILHPLGAVGFYLWTVIAVVVLTGLALYWFFA